MILLLLLLSISSFISIEAGILCPTGYADNGQGSCYSITAKYGRHFEAYDRCAKDSAYMFDIKSAFDNAQVQTTATGVSIIWLGLTCLSDSFTSCVWDSGRAVGPADYNNFNGGVPQTAIGACVIMDVGSGKWYSSDCTQTQAQGYCQYTPGIRVPSCLDGSMYFRGKCYMSILTYDLKTAEDLCKKDCGETVSVHSSGEDSFVRDVASLIPGALFSFLGLNHDDDGYSWYDETSYDYSNFGYEDTSIGNCVAIALQNDLLKAGKWISSDCDSEAAVSTVCKKDVVNTCNTVPSVIQPPPLCFSPFFVNGSGTIYSPGYPGSNLANNCEFVISEVKGKQVTMTFTQLSLDRNSTIQLFNGIFASAPFATLTYKDKVGKTYISPGNSVKMMYNTYGGPVNYFRAEFGDGTDLIPVSPTQDPQCNGGDFYDTGRITSPNYPKDYPPQVDCEYRIHSSKNRVVINFNDILTEDGNNDYIAVYDFNGIQIAQISGGPFNNYTLSSFTSEMKILFHTDRYYEFRGFSANFYSIY